MYKDIISSLRSFYNSNLTLSYSFRKNALLTLKKSLYDNYDLLKESIKLDFNKSEFDFLSTEFMIVINEINYFLKHLKHLMKPKRVSTGIINFKSKGLIYNDPYGLVLIISPWNYPVQLSLVPLVASIAGGNTTVLLPSTKTPNTTEAIKKVLSCFNDNYIKVITGEKDETSKILDYKFDYIFFTGSKDIGKIVYNKASLNLTPVTLELGGKSPCIITTQANLKKAVKRIIWGKTINAGQTCVAPDYILVEESIHDELINLLNEEINKQCLENGNLTPNFPQIINESNYNRLTSYTTLKNQKLAPKFPPRLIFPEIIDNVSYQDKIMQEEIFGPLLPVITYKNLDEVINYLKLKEKPLALYLFSKDKKEINKVMKEISFGGGCVNDTIMHLTSTNLPFGGVGDSGMGSYHGKYSYLTFTHQKSVLKKGNIELNLKYPKTNIKKLKLLKFINKVK